MVEGLEDLMLVVSPGEVVGMEEVAEMDWGGGGGRRGASRGRANDVDGRDDGVHRSRGIHLPHRRPRQDPHNTPVAFNTSAQCRFEKIILKNA
jgi:hypothetical protein